ncbi:MAG: hypothetical protein Q9227_007986 [Pyrenula ochraceoflavens]
MVPRNDQTLRRPPVRRENSNSKASFISPATSSEADDEESLASDLHNGSRRSSIMHRRPPQYDGEDTRLTSQKELAGWYSYGWAAEVFVVCAMGSFLPITLEQLARDQGVLERDPRIPCKASWKPSFLSADAGDDLFHSSKKKAEHSACIVKILGLDINTASFAMYTFSISVLVQALLIISMSGVADHGPYRKFLLLLLGFVGAIATMAFLPVTSEFYLLAALFAVICNTCFGASFVLLNSFLPILVRQHPSIQSPEYEDLTVQFEADSDEVIAVSTSVPEDSEVEVSGPAAALLPRDQPDRTEPMPPAPAALSPELKLSTRISSNGIGIGYIAAVIVQSIAVFVVKATGSTTFSLRLVVFFIGAWWFCFTIPAAVWLRPRPGPPLSGHSGRSWLAYFAYAWKALGKTVLRARRLKDMVLFLGAWFLLSDGIATVSGTAVLFAKTELDMGLAALALINVIVTISGIVGAFSWSYISRFFQLRASHTIVACICILEIIPIYGLLGFIPAIQEMGVFGLQQPWEMYPLGGVYGFLLGGLSSYCRSFFGELIPPGSEAAFYALYAITDKGSSIFGPAIVGAITDAYGEIRPAFIFLAILIGLPLPLMLLIDVDRGKGEAAEMARELEGKAIVDASQRSYGTIPTINLVAEEAEERTRTGN